MDLVSIYIFLVLKEMAMNKQQTLAIAIKQLNHLALGLLAGSNDSNLDVKQILESIQSLCNEVIDDD